MNSLLPRVSIIVPVYNAQETIKPLVNSVLSQEEQSWELILVDDGSKDETPMLCDEVSMLDNRIKVLHQTNLGVSSARNNGIKAAKGDWITFVDADDLLTDNFLSCMLEAADKSTVIDLVYCSYSIIESGRTTICLYRNKTYLGYEEIKEAFRNTKIMYRCCPWAKLFRRNVIQENRLSFDTKLSISEDRLFLYNYLLFVRGIATTSTMGYIYGSFSSISLKHKKHSVDTMTYRQNVMTDAMRAVYNAFSITASDELYMWRHLMMILVETMECVYSQYRGGKKTESLQMKILQENYFDAMNQSALNNPVWKKQYESDMMLQLVISGRFKEFNRFLKRKDRNLSLRLFVHKLLKKTQSVGSYERVILAIN